MKNVYKVVVLGSPKVGKTTLIEEAMYGNRVRLNGPYEPTLEDIYCVSVDIDSKTRDKMYLYDYSGVVSSTHLFAQFNVFNLTIATISIVTGASIEFGYYKNVFIFL